MMQGARNSLAIPGESVTKVTRKAKQGKKPMTQNNVPPATLKAIVDAIAIKRNVTLYKDN